MSNKKSKLPTVGEITKYVGMFFGDVGKSVKGIMEEYNKNHSDDAENASPEVKTEEPTVTTQTEQKTTTTEEVKKVDDTHHEGEEHKDENDNNVTPQ